VLVNPASALLETTPASHCAPGASVANSTLHLLTDQFVMKAERQACDAHNGHPSQKARKRQEAGGTFEESNGEVSEVPQSTGRAGRSQRAFAVAVVQISIRCSVTPGGELLRRQLPGVRQPWFDVGVPAPNPPEDSAEGGSIGAGVLAFEWWRDDGNATISYADGTIRSLPMSRTRAIEVAEAAFGADRVPEELQTGAGLRWTHLPIGD
jgi:hypothetical protein